MQNEWTWPQVWMTVRHLLEESLWLREEEAKREREHKRSQGNSRPSRSRRGSRSGNVETIRTEIDFGSWVKGIVAQDRKAKFGEGK